MQALNILSDKTQPLSLELHKHASESQRCTQVEQDDKTSNHDKEKPQTEHTPEDEKPYEDSGEIRFNFGKYVISASKK